jgi:predicted nucleotide-binding protein
MNKKEALAKLEEFKELIDLWRKLDYNSPDIQKIRTEISKTLPLAHDLVRRAGRNKTYTITPPPAVGGFVMRNIDPFDNFFDPPYGMSLIPSIIDSIDETIGVIENTPNFKFEIIPTKKTKAKKLAIDSRKIFIVHGHDNELKETVARFLEKMDLIPIILHEQASASQTIIEKFEKYSEVQYSLVLMSPDDIGGSKEDSSKLKSRARQNVIFELGYFYGKLGRKNVCALLKGDIELPSDNDGIIYIAIDKKDGWKMLLAKELKEAGLDIDMNKIF